MLKHLIVYGSRYGELPINLTNYVKSVKIEWLFECGQYEGNVAENKKLLKKRFTMGDKPISFRDKDGNFVSAADVWNPKKLEELFTRLNPNRKFRLERERLAKEEAAKHPELNEETEQV